MTKKVPIHIEKIEKKPISNHDNINRIQISQDKSKTKNGTISSSFDEFVDESDDLTYLSNLYLNDLESCLIGYTDPITYDKESKHMWLDDTYSTIKSDRKLESIYEVNKDPNPEVIHKKCSKTIEYVQEVAVRYLRPPTPPAPGDIVIQEMDFEYSAPVPPPIIIRQQPSRPKTPEALVIRERPPPPPKIDTQPVFIKIPGYQLPPPPRRVIFERLPKLPNKPQSILFERWLPYKRPKRRVVFLPSQPRRPTRNLIVEWGPPKVDIRHEYKCLGVVRANPIEYENRYKNKLVSKSEVVGLMRDIGGVVDNNELFANKNDEKIEEEELVGDVQFLAFVDLEREGLGKYRDYLHRKGILSSKKPQSPPTKQKRLSFNETEILDLAEKIFFAITDDGRISFDDAELIFHKLHNSTLFRKMDRLDLKTFFSILDKNKSGSLSLNEFKHAFISLSALYN